MVLQEKTKLIKYYASAAKDNFFKIGKILTEIRNQKFFKESYDSFTEYLNSEDFEFNRRYAYKLIEVYEEFGDVPSMAQLGLAKLIQLTYVSDREEREALAVKAKDIPVSKLKDEVKLVKSIHRGFQRQDEDINIGDSQVDKCLRLGRDLISKIEALKTPLNEIKERVNSWVKFSDKFTETSSLKNEVIKKFEELKEV